MLSKHKIESSSQGFTLIELLVVIVIIGILSGALIAVINPATQQRKARETVLRSNTDKLCIAMEACAASRGDPRNDCDTLAEVGANNPNGQPVGSTYTVAYGNITINGVANNNVLYVQGSNTTGSTCSYACTYNPVSGASVPTARVVNANCISE